MRNVLICSDGSSKRNGKPNCIAGYGVWSSVGEYRSGYETASTSQRGELTGIYNALTMGLPYAQRGDSVFIITDSAYIANCLNKKWYTKWQRLGWVTATGSAVKNQDLWTKIISAVDKYPEDNLMIYQIKGHLLEKINRKGDEAFLAGLDKFAANNDGARPDREVFVDMITGNYAADLLAQHGCAIGDDSQHRDDIDTKVYELTTDEETVCSLL